jgi:hypothetical protein
MAENLRGVLTLVALGLVIIIGLAACAGVPTESGSATLPWEWRTGTGPGYYGGPPPSWR